MPTYLSHCLFCSNDGNVGGQKGHAATAFRNVPQSMAISRGTFSSKTGCV